MAGVVRSTLSRLRITSYNIAFQSIYHEERFAVLFNRRRDKNCDIIALQEVSS